MKPSEILPLVFESSFFENDLKLNKAEIFAFLEYIDKEMKSGILLKKDKEFQLIDYLIDKSKAYRATTEN